MRFQELKPAITILKDGGVGIMGTDTLYGIVGSAQNKKAVERIYVLKGREEDKPFIILISRFSDLKHFGIEPDRKTRKTLRRYWPGPFSIILPAQQQSLSYLHRGKENLAFRLPKPLWLRKFLKKTGPLVAPSANPEGERPAQTIEEAKEYFSDRADFYIDFGRIESAPSTVMKLSEGGVEIVRGGSSVL
ncbi:MAG: L-threonylcarbamoyladenylate synthase [Candidatus Harrisonbacteria bacterium]|nr:L-threonylcarbamoyladenylate synthase [Candidatus Harrisonbacteria bacterium]